MEIYGRYSRDLLHKCDCLHLNDFLTRAVLNAQQVLVKLKNKNWVLWDLWKLAWGKINK